MHLYGKRSEVVGGELSSLTVLGSLILSVFSGLRIEKSGFTSGWGRYVMFSGKSLYSHTVCLHPGFESKYILASCKLLDNIAVGDKLAMDDHIIPSRETRKTRPIPRIVETSNFTEQWKSFYTF